jgi:hypothetical protein
MRRVDWKFTILYDVEAFFLSSQKSFTMSSPDRKRKSGAVDVEEEISTPPSSHSHLDGAPQSVKRSKGVPYTYTSKMILDDDREVTSGTPWARDFVQEIAGGNIVKVKISHKVGDHMY